MGQFERKDEDGNDLGLDLDHKACPVCRRELLPWEDVCPEDGARAVPKDQLPSDRDPLLERFLQEGRDDISG